MVFRKTFYCNLPDVVLGKRLGLVLSMLWMVFVTGCGPATPPPSELAFGQEPYLRYCASCHGNQGQGKLPTFPPLAGSEWLALGPDALGLIVLYGLKGEIEVSGRTYRGYMPPMQHISDEDIAAILTYMGRDWAEREDAVSAARIAELRQVFAEPRPPLDGKPGLMAALEEISQ